MIENVIDAARQPFLDIAADIHGSLVYLDAGAAEVAQLTLGPAFLLGLGAANVCSLEQAHPDDALLSVLASGGQPVTSLVVFTTQLLTETHQHILHLLMVHPHVRRCQMFCSVSELAHAQLSPEVCDLNVEAYSEYVAELRQGLAARRAAAGLPMPREDVLQLSVRHLPLHITALDTNTFVLPAASAAASKAVAGGRAAGFAGTDSRADDDADEGAVGASSGLSLLPHALADLSKVLGAKLEPFAIGPVSLAIAKELVTLPQQGHRPGTVSGPDSSNDSPRGGVAAAAGGSAASLSGSIGLVLIDRSLDLATPCMHAEHVLDVVFNFLARPVPHEPSTAAAAAAGQGRTAAARAALRPADLRVDVPRLAPMHPLPPPPPPAPNTPPLQPPQPQLGASSSSTDDIPAASDTPAADSNSNSSDAANAVGHDSGSSSSSYPELWGGQMGLSLFHPEDRRWLGWLRQLWAKPHKDVLLLLRKWLKEALRAEKITPARTKLTPLVSPSELITLAHCLMAQPDVFLRHQPIVGLALAAAAALSTDAAAVAATAAGGSGGGGGGGQPAPFTCWERLCGYERQLLLALPEGGQGSGMLLPMLLEAISRAHPQQQQLHVDDVLQLLLVSYSLSGDRQPAACPLYSADEGQLREALADVIMAQAQAAAEPQQHNQQHNQQQQRQQQQQQQDGLAMLWRELQSLPHIQQLLVESLQSGRLSADAAGVRDEVSRHLLELFQRLRWLAAARGKLRDVRRLMEVAVDTGVASSCIPLLRQVLSKILLQADNRDLQQPESASLVAGLLTKGLGRLGFGGIAAPAGRPKISDYPAVLLFVVGGISPAEVRHLRQELDLHVYGHKPLVLLGGTTLLSAADASRLFLS